MFKITMFQIAKFEETLKQKNDLLTCFKGSKVRNFKHLNKVKQPRQTIRISIFALNFFYDKFSSRLNSLRYAIVLTIPKRYESQNILKFGCG